MPAELRSLTVDIDTGRWRDTVMTEVDLSVRDGQVTVLLGGPGDGKTMVAYALTGRLPESARAGGEVLVDGRVGYVPQDGIEVFTPDRRSVRNWGSWNRGTEIGQSNGPAPLPVTRRKRGICCRSTTLLVRFSAPQSPPHWLTHPDVLIADSPTASLDQGTAFGVWQSIRQYADTGAAVLVITHDLPLLTATGYADHLAILSRGQVVEAGPMDDLRLSEDPRVRMYCRG